MLLIEIVLRYIMNPDEHKFADQNKEKISVFLKQSQQLVY